MDKVESSGQGGRSREEAEEEVLIFLSKLCIPSMELSARHALQNLLQYKYCALLFYSWKSKTQKVKQLVQSHTAYQEGKLMSEVKSPEQGCHRTPLCASPSSD